MIFSVSILFVSTHSSNLLNLNRDATYHMLEYLPLQDEVHNYRLTCKSCHNISKEQDEQIYADVQQIWHQLNHIHRYPNDSTPAIQEITRLYNSLRFRPKFASYLPDLIRQVIHVNTPEQYPQLLYLFNIKIIQDPDKFETLTPLNKLLLRSSRAILNYIQGYTDLSMNRIDGIDGIDVMDAPRQIYKIIFDFTFDYLSNTRNNQTLQMDQLIELGLILWDPCTKINVNDLDVLQFMSMLGTSFNDKFIHSISRGNGKQYQSFFNELDLCVVLKWIKMADLDESQQFKHAIFKSRMDRHLIVQRVVNYLYETEQYGVIRHLFKKLYLCHPIVPSMQILNFNFHRFIREVLLEWYRYSLVNHRKGVQIISNEVCPSVVSFLNDAVLRYYHFNGTEQDLQRIKQGVFDLNSYLGDNIQIVKENKMRISALIINLVFIDFQKDQHLELENVALLKLLRRTEHFRTAMEVKRHYKEYKRFQQHVLRFVAPWSPETTSC